MWVLGTPGFGNLGRGPGRTASIQLGYLTNYYLAQRKPGRVLTFILALDVVVLILVLVVILLLIGLREQAHHPVLVVDVLLLVS